MVRSTKNKNIKQIKKKNNIFRFSAISLLVIFSFFTLPTINIFLDKNECIKFANKNKIFINII